MLNLRQNSISCKAFSLLFCPKVYFLIVHLAFFSTSVMHKRLPALQQRRTAWSGVNIFVDIITPTNGHLGPDTVGYHEWISGGTPVALELRPWTATSPVQIFNLRTKCISLSHLVFCIFMLIYIMLWYVFDILAVQFGWFILPTGLVLSGLVSNVDQQYNSIRHVIRD